MRRTGKAVMIALALASFALIAVATFLPNARLWGINHLSYFPSPLRLAFLGLVALCFLPAFARILVEGFLSIGQLLCRPRRQGVLLVLLLAVLSVAVFWGLRAGTSLLGDGHLLVRSYAAAQNGDRNLVISSTGSILHSERIAIGTSLLYLWSGKIAARFWGASWVDGMRFFNCLMGGIFVMVLLLVARSRSWHPTTRLWLLILVLFSAFMELFFGYTENYTPLMLCLLLYAVSGVRVLHSRGSLLWPLLAQLVAIFLHVQALVMVPSLVYLFFWRHSARPEAFVERRLPLILGVLMVFGLVVARFTPLAGFLLPWRAAAGGQAVLTLGHGLDVGNEILMLLPALLLFLGMAVLLGKETGWSRALVAVPADSSSKANTGSRRASSSRSSRPRRASAPTTSAEALTPWLQTRAEWQFFQLQAWGCLLYLVFFEAEIGVARDWDLFAMLGVPLIPMCLILWNRYIQGKDDGKSTSVDAVLMASMWALTVVLGMSWVLLNHSVPHTTRRFAAILSWETAKVPYGMEALAATYYDNGQVEQAVNAMQAAVQMTPNGRLRALLGTYLFDAGDYAGARQLLEEQLQGNPKDIKIRNWLIRTLYEQKDYRQQEAVLRDGLALHPQEARFHLLLGELLIRQGKVEAGVAELRQGRQGDMPAAARQHIDRLIQQYETQPSSQP